LPTGGAGAATGGAVGALVSAGEGSAPVLTLVAGGSAEGSGGGPIGALIGIIGAVGTYDAVQGYKLGQAYGWWGQPDLAGRARCENPSPTPSPSPSPIATPSPTPSPTPEDEDDECEYMGDWRMRQRGIDGHSFKQDFLGKKAPVKLWDICACKDGSIKIKAQGACGKSGPSIDTGYTWK
jgi:hypothetical protein